MDVESHQLVRILPLVLHASARLPAITPRFSDQLPSASLAVTQGAKTVLTTTAPHGHAVGSYIGLSVVDANVPNRIVSAVASNGDWLLTTEFEHDLSVSPSNQNLRSWNLVARLGGFASTDMNGLLQLVSVPSRTTFVVKPPAYVSAITLSGSEAVFERMENGIIGWHKMRSAGANTLEFDTPADVGRTYVVPSPTIATNIRVIGALTLDAAKHQLTRGYVAGGTTQDSAEIAKAWLVITPPPSVAMSKDRNASTDGVAEITPQSEYRQVLIDGFHVYVFLPAENSAGGIACSDAASGDIFTAVLRTFHGLSLPRRELFQGDSFVALMVEHGNAIGDYDRATYIHGYVFQAPAYLTQLDAIQQFEWSHINESQMTAASGIGPGSSGGVIDTSAPVAPIGSVSFRGLEIGIRHDDAPQPLSATVSLS